MAIPKNVSRRYLAWFVGLRFTNPTYKLQAYELLGLD